MHSLFEQTNELLKNAIIPLVAVMGLVIAYRQYRVARDKFVLDLFDKRMEVYELTMRFVGKVLQDLAPEHADFRTSWLARNKADFLFGEDVRKLLKEIHENASKVRYFTQNRDHIPLGERAEAAEKHLALQEKFGNYHEEIVPMFAKYMRLDNARSVSLYSRIFGWLREKQSSRG